MGKRSGKIPTFYSVQISYNNILSRNFDFRYGDQVDPWGDIITMGRAWCRMKSGARALVGLPAGNDVICFNSQRRYGPFLYTKLMICAMSVVLILLLTKNDS